MYCDCHVHVVGPIERYPQLPSRTYLADQAPLERLRSLGAGCGVTRFVIVQPSFYGSDNTLTLESLDALGGAGRGVAVIDLDTRSSILETMARRGIRGLRLNLYSTAGRADSRPLAETFGALAAVAQRMRWHVEVIASVDILVQHAALLAAAPVPVVIDHYGLYGEATPEHDRARQLLDLLRRPHVWVKLSAPYRVLADPLATRPDPHWLAAMLDVAAERCVWGSDWPHTPLPREHRGADVIAPYRALSYRRLFDGFTAALGARAPGSALVEQILQHNPARLYEF